MPLPRRRIKINQLPSRAHFPASTEPMPDWTTITLAIKESTGSEAFTSHLYFNGNPVATNRTPSPEATQAQRELSTGYLSWFEQPQLPPVEEQTLTQPGPDVAHFGCDPGAFEFRRRIHRWGSSSGVQRPESTLLRLGATEWGRRGPSGRGVGGQAGETGRREP